MQTSGKTKISISDEDTSPAALRKHCVELANVCQLHLLHSKQ